MDNFKEYIRQINLIQKRFAQYAQLIALVESPHGLLNHEPGSGVAAGKLKNILFGRDSNQEQHDCRCQHIQRSTANRLVCFQINRGKGKQQGKGLLKEV